MALNLLVSCKVIISLVTVLVLIITTSNADHPAATSIP